MSTLHYYVSLGGQNLHRVTSFAQTSQRDITDYDSVGGGKFNVPDAHAAREWVIKCQLLQENAQIAGLSSKNATLLFIQFEKWLEQAAVPIRMVKTDKLYPHASISALVWLKSYPYEETSQGVYDTTITVVEYKPVGVKTTGVPYVARPGKVPVPAVITTSSSNTVYKVKHKYGASASGNPSGSTSGNTMAALRLIDKKSAKPVNNDSNVKNSTSVHIDSTGYKNVQSTTTYTEYDGTTVEAPDATSARNAVVGWAKNVWGWFKKNVYIK